MREDTRERVERELRVLLRRHAHAPNQVERVLERKLLRFMVVRECRQVARNELDATAIEKCPVARHRYEHRPAAVIRYPDDRVTHS